MADNVQNIVIKYSADTSGLAQANKSLTDVTKREEQLKTAIDEVNKTSAKTGDIIQEAGEKAADGLDKSTKSADAFRGAMGKTVGDVRVFGVTLGEAREKLSGMASGFGSAVKGAATLGTGLKLLTAIPIILLFSGLVAVLTKTQAGMNFLERATASLGAAFSVLTNSVTTLGEGLVKLFDNPKRLFTDFNGVVKDLTKGFDNLGGKIADAARDMGVLSKELQDLDDRQRDLNVENALAEQQVTRLILQAKNRTLTERDRLKLLDEASAIETKAFNTQLEQERKRLENIIKRNNITQQGAEKTDAQLKAEADQRERIIRLETESMNLQEKISNRRAQLLEEEQERQRKWWAEKKKQFQIEHIQERELTQILAERTVAMIQAEEDTTLKGQELSAARISHWLEENKQKVEIAQETARLLGELGNQLFASEIQRGEERLAALEDAQARELALTGDNARARQEIDREYAKRRKEVEAEIAQAKRKQAVLNKGLAISDITVDTAAAMVKAFRDSPKTFGMPWIAVAAALGAIKIATVAATPIPKYATGVIDLQGPGTSTSDSILARLSAGESVMTARETKEFKPLLQAIRNGDIEPEGVTAALAIYDRMAAIRFNVPPGLAVSSSGNLELLEEVRGLNDTLKTLPIHQTYIDKNGFQRFIQQGNSRTQYLNSHF